MIIIRECRFSSIADDVEKKLIEEDIEDFEVGNISIPLVENKNIGGFKKIVGLQNTYGFSDNVIEFESYGEAKDFLKNKKGSIKDKVKELIR